MTFAEQVIENIEAAGGVLTVSGDRIRCRLPEDLAHLLDDLKVHKDEVIVALRHRDIPPMPEGVKLLSWKLRAAPAILTRLTVVNDVAGYVSTTLHELDIALHQQHDAMAIRECLDRLEECGVTVRIVGDRR